MLLSEWVDPDPAKGRSIKKLAAESGFSYTTVFPYAHNKPVKAYSTAETISAATKGAVTVPELLDPQAFGAPKYVPPPAVRKAQSRRRTRKKAA